MKSNWRLLNEVLKITKKQVLMLFKVDDREIYDPTRIANQFCEYLIGPNLVN